jgi:multicomponent Na+:H+ antiporter subunit G
MSWTAAADVVAALCFLGGSLLALVAAVGLIRFPDLLSRMHAGTKPQVLGLILMAAGLVLHLRRAEVVGLLLLVVVFQMITAPVAAHMVGRAGYRTGRIRADLLVRDELTIDLEAAHLHAQERAASGEDDGRQGTGRSDPA